MIWWSFDWFLKRCEQVTWVSSWDAIASKNETNSISPLSKCKCVILSSDNECNWITKTSQFWRHANHQEVWNFSDIEFSKQCLLQSCKYVLYCTYCHLDYQNESILQTNKKSRTSWILKLQNNVSLLTLSWMGFFDHFITSCIT